MSLLQSKQYNGMHMQYIHVITSGGWINSESSLKAIGSGLQLKLVWSGGDGWGTHSLQHQVLYSGYLGGSRKPGKLEVGNQFSSTASPPPPLPPVCDGGCGSVYNVVWSFSPLLPYGRKFWLEDILADCL